MTTISANRPLILVLVVLGALFLVAVLVLAANVLVS